MPDKPDDDFDPYYKWLGIPPALQPPDHYRLLGLRHFEEDPEVIAVASDRQMAHVKSFAVGKYGRHSQMLLAELAKAKICLLNPDKKAMYDSELAAQVMPINEIESLIRSTDAHTKVILQDSVLPLQNSVEINAYESISARRRRGQEKSLLIPFLIVSLTLVSAGMIALQWNARNNPAPDASLVSKQPEQSDVEDLPTDPETGSKQPSQDDSELDSNHNNQEQFAPPPPEEQSEPQPEPRPKPKLHGLPDCVDLPLSNDREVQLLCEVPEGSSLILRSSSSLIQFDGEKILWGSENPQLVGGLTIHEGAVKFRWAENPPEESEAAVKNSLVTIMLGNESHVVALRSPQVVEPFRFDLTKPTQRILCNCDYLPDNDKIQFEILNSDAIAPLDVGGSQSIRLRNLGRHQVKHMESSFSSTNFNMRRVGNVPSVVIRTTFGVQSGGIGALVRRQLNRTLGIINEDILDIDAELVGLKSIKPTGNTRYKAELNSRINALEAEKLLAIADRDVLKKTEILANRLDNLELHYRFFIMVDGYEIDLITTDK
jgi:hypothetical protein